MLSTGERVPAPRPLKRARRKLARLNRERARRRPGSGGRRETRAKLARLHARIAHVRRDALPPRTTRLAREYGTVVVERLRGAGMLRNRRLARAVADAGMAAWRRQRACKTAWSGSRLLATDPFFPSSKTCSACRAVKRDLPLWERTVRCDACGLVRDRDANAARNLAALAAGVAGSGPETENARGRDARPGAWRAVPEETGSPQGLRL